MQLLKYLIINNPASGKHGNKNETELKTTIAKKDYTWINTQPSQTLTQQIKNVGIHFDCVVVSGGDGTVNDAIQALKTLSMDVRVLIYPTGTTNEFATHRNLTQKRCLDAINNPTTELATYDAGWVDQTHWFIYSLSFGTITKLSYMTPQEYKNKLGYCGYWVYGLVSRMWMKMKDYEMRVTIDDTVYTDQYIFGSVTNSYSLGSVLKLDEDEVSFDDGLFEVLLIKKPTKLRHYKAIISGLLTKNYNSEYITFKKARHVEIDSKRKVSWNLDGEFHARNQHISIEVKKSAIQC